MYALVEIKGKQYKAEKGALLKVDRVEGEQGDVLEFENVMLVSSDDVKVGNPYVEGVKVATKIEEHGKGRKVLVYKYKRRKGYERRQGHRQQYSFLRVEDIVGA